METFCDEVRCDYHLQNNLKGEKMYKSFMDKLRCMGYAFSARNSLRNSSEATNDHQHTDHDYITSRGSASAINFDKVSGWPYYNGKSSYIVCAHGEKYYQKKTSSHFNQQPIYPLAM